MASRIRSMSSSVSPKLGKILVANRGEIAARVFRTARRMGIPSVAICSEGDKQAFHVRMADEMVCVGPSRLVDSYLNVDRVVDAARSVGATLVHPGYGFLSENVDFAMALREAGIGFVGPSPEAIRAMGDKIQSKQIALEAGVHVIPGFVGQVKSAQHAVSVAEEVGFPVMVKASAGGGGKGMRIARTAADVREAFRLCTAEAKSYFGDDRLLIERFIEQPRHIEIQIMADQHGHIVYLPERECSIQRRNQKVIEEAPSPFVDLALRTQMGEQAVALARAVGYSSAGTVECLVSGINRSFYFLEMNTRLQVEHPVTEAVTGLDLVQLMIESAMGMPLRLKQENLEPNGWAMEARIYAENPMRGFLPAGGTLRTYVEPKGLAVPRSGHDSSLQACHDFDDGGIRIDSGVEEGSQISLAYDPMLSKVIARSTSRETTRKRLEEALDRYVIDGVTSNIPFIQALLRNARYCEGNLTTALVAEEWPDGFKGVEWTDQERATMFIFVSQLYFDAHPLHSSVVVRLGSESLCVVRRSSDSFEVEGQDIRTMMPALECCWEPGHYGRQRLVKILQDSGNMYIQVRYPISLDVTRVQCVYKGQDIEFVLRRPDIAEMEDICQASLVVSEEDLVIRAPMPGNVISVSIQPGELVAKDQELVVLEAMKMQNIIRAPREGIIAAVSCKAGDVVMVDSILAEFAKGESL